MAFFGFQVRKRTHDRFRGGEAIDALETLLRISGPGTKFIPGHGSVVGREAVAAHRDMIVDVVDRVKKMIAEGKMRDEVLTARLTASYDARVPGGLDQLPQSTATTADRFVDAAYSQLKPKR